MIKVEIVAYEIIPFTKDDQKIGLVYNISAATTSSTVLILETWVLSMNYCKENFAFLK